MNGSSLEWNVNQSGFAELSDVTSIQSKGCRRKFGEDECIVFGDRDVSAHPLVFVSNTF
jgi:hypothetical protein